MPKDWVRMVRSRRRERLAAEERRRVQIRHSPKIWRLNDRDPAFLKDGKPIVFCVVRNEETSIPYFLEWYRRLGFCGFIFVINHSTDNTLELLRAEPDVLLYQSDASFLEAKGGAYWCNDVLDRHEVDQWVLLADADEQWIDPFREDQSIERIIERAERAGDSFVTAPLIDMYSGGSFLESSYRAGESFLKECPYFDGPESYQGRWRANPFIPGCMYVDVCGGPRARFFPFYTRRPPLLTKSALVRWSGSSSFLNKHFFRNGIAGEASTFACILHFKFLGDFTAKCVAAERHGQYFLGSFEYKTYQRGEKLHGSGTLRTPVSREFLSYRDFDWAVRACELIRLREEREPKWFDEILAAGEPRDSLI